MKATIVRQYELPNLPSASGIELVGNTAYIIGDDSPFLYSCSAESLAPNTPLALFETAHFSSGRIPKDRKPDLECLTAITTGPETALLACGSGATAAREQGFWVALPAGPGTATVQPVSLSRLYAALRQVLPKGITLNLEAAAATDTELLLFQRTVGAAAGNIVFRLPLAAALECIRHQREVPPVQLQHFALPTIEGKDAGFSGACTFDNKVFITASVEDTADAIADGEVLGSFVGVLPAPSATTKATALQMAHLVLPNGQPYRGKVESIVVRRPLGAGRYEALLVTDDDAGGSTAVLIELHAA
ncbi:DUF6929 family protein [Hymenobacter cellulosilyticus]|uniref:Uncharacterized protein n=1 Tax=Hymenobacter cellulosilyticus TaxID=2932248 RepID=A0A8T9QGL0_9BACT|nr:hypothetical protein [Hymenobacter cellulosilyticus]UOQ74709.1 hypothetical protein MUN79_13030 [Hymenobacter cellulosilyticus]